MSRECITSKNKITYANTINITNTTNLPVIPTQTTSVKSFNYSTASPTFPTCHHSLWVIASSTVPLRGILSFK